MPSMYVHMFMSCLLVYMSGHGKQMKESSHRKAASTVSLRFMQVWESGHKMAMAIIIVIYDAYDVLSLI